jgi:hypothetical protein
MRIRNSDFASMVRRTAYRDHALMLTGS